jgi:hypothetical protein
MATKRDLKKDINFLTEEIIEACFLHQHFKKDQEGEVERINLLIEETVSLRNDLLFKINHPTEQLQGSKLKAWYNDILGQMMQKTDDVFDQLGQLAVNE